jgi:hypothetical protein
VWNRALSGHNNAGTTGAALNKLNVAPTPSVASPFNPSTGTLELVFGMDYPGTNPWNTIEITHGISGLNLTTITPAPTLKFSIKRAATPAGGTPILSVTTVSIVDNDTVRVTLTAEQTAEYGLIYESDDYVYDLWMVSGGVDTRLAYGVCQIKDAVTRSS